MDNYTSPYGFGILTDAVLDSVADRHGVGVDEINERLERRLYRDDDHYASEDSVLTDTVRDWVDNEAWDTVLGPAVDEFDKRLFPEDPSAEEKE
jgi:hypothetical protein